MRQSIIKLHGKQNEIEDKLRTIIKTEHNFKDNKEYVKLEEELTEYRQEAKNLQEKNNIKLSDIISRGSFSKAKKAIEAAGIKSEKQKPEIPKRRRKERSVPDYENVTLIRKRPAMPPTEHENKQTKMQDTWQCENCDFINDMNSKTCDVCNERNNNFEMKLTAAIKRQIIEREKQELKHDTWNCEFCTLANSLDVNVCVACSKTRTGIPGPSTNLSYFPPQQAVPWLCSYCTMENEPREKICIACAKTKTPDAKPKKCAPVQKKPDWKCHSCHQPYPSDINECVFCTTAGIVDASVIAEGWNCSSCTFENISAAKICEMCGTKQTRPPPSVCLLMLFFKISEYYHKY